MPPTLQQLGLASLTDVGVSWPTFAELVRVLTFRAGYNTSVVLLGTTLLGLAAGVIGALALLRKQSLTADALSHATLPGVAGAFITASLLGFEGRTLPVLLVGAAVGGVVGVLLVQAMLRFTRLTEDTAIAATLSVTFGAGIVMLSVIQSMEGGNKGGLKTFIYGQTAAMHPSDAMLMGAIALAAVVIAALLLKELALTAFNEPFARVIGLPVAALDLLLLALIVLVTVSGLQAVGMLLVVALLIIPAAAARFWTSRVAALVALSGVLGACSGFLGAATSALLPRSPAGAVIVLTAGVLFFVSLLVAPGRGVVAAAVRRAMLRLRVAEDHQLARLLAHEHDAARATAESRRLASPPVLRWLARRGLVARDGAASWSLTELGRVRAQRVQRNRRLWEAYLVAHADVAASHVDWSADLVEHVLSPEMIAALERQPAPAAADPKWGGSA